MSDNIEEAAYYLRLISMYIDLGTETVVKVFYHLTPKENVQAFFSSPDTRNVLKTLHKNKDLSSKGYKLVLYNPNPDKFDVSLLITLLTKLDIGKLTAPKNGWKSPPDLQDFTIAADLLRLRDIRNKIIAHRHRARLFKVQFDNLWKRVEDILLRLITAVDSGSETNLKEKITEYKNRKLDPRNYEEQKYLEKLRDWWESCEEVSKLQEQVETLVKNTQEFMLFFKSIPERYPRYIKLLFDGGRAVLSGQLLSEVSKQNEPLEMILRAKQDFLKDEFSSEKMYEQLFPGREENTIVNTSIETWDISVMAIVIIRVFSVDEITLTNVSTIMEARNNYAKAALIALDSDLFTSCCEDLLSSIRVLSCRLGRDIYKMCNEVIDIYKKKSESISDELDLYFEQLRRHGLEIKTIAEVYKETVDKLKESVKQMEEEGIAFKRDHVLQLKMVTLGNNEEKKKVAEDTLETVWQAALKTSENPEEFEAVRQALDLILNDIRRITDVKAENIEKGSILLSVRCFSWRGILLLIEYFNSSDFECQLKRMADELYLLYNDVIVIASKLTAESMLDVLLNLESPKDEQQQFISLPIKCTSAKGMKQVLDIVGNERTINRFNEIAECLSEQFGDIISISVKSDIGGFGDVFREESEHSSSNSIDDDDNNVDCQMNTPVIPAGESHCMSENKPPYPDFQQLLTESEHSRSNNFDGVNYVDSQRNTSVIPAGESHCMSENKPLYPDFQQLLTDNQQVFHLQIGKSDSELCWDEADIKQECVGSPERLVEEPVAPDQLKEHLDCSVSLYHRHIVKRATKKAGGKYESNTVIDLDDSRAEESFNEEDLVPHQLKELHCKESLLLMDKGYRQEDIEQAFKRAGEKYEHQHLVGSREFHPENHDDNNTEHHHLLEENRILKEMKACKICMDKDACIVFIPCGHGISCVECAHRQRTCAVCRAEIREWVQFR